MSTLDPLWKNILIEKTVATTDTTIDFTGPSGWGTPAFCIVLWGQSAPGTGSPRTGAWNIGSIGFYDGTTQGSAGWASEDGLSSTNNYSHTTNNRAVLIPNASGSTTYYAEYTASFITDGVRLTKVKNNMGGDKFVQVMMWRGSSIKNVRVGIDDINGKTSWVLNGGGSWTPNYCLFTHTGNISIGGRSSAHFGFGWAMENIGGAGNGTFKQGCVTIQSADAVSTSNVYAYSSGSKFLMENNLSSSYTATATGFFTSGANAGLTMTETWPSANQVVYLAMELENATNDTDMCIERMANWWFDEAGSNILSKANLLDKENNFTGSFIIPTVAVQANETVETSTNFLGLGAVFLRDGFGKLGGISFQEEDGAGTSNCGGVTNGPWFIRMPLENDQNGRSWQGGFVDRIQGGELNLHDSFSTLPTGYKQPFTVLAWGRGIREIYNGSELVQPILDGYYPYKDVYVGSTKVYGEPDHDWEDVP